MSIVLLLLLLAPDVPLAAARVPDTELADQRGGFTLPSGIDVALTVQTQTSLNGATVLSTVFRAQNGAPTLTVTAPGDGVVTQDTQGGRQNVMLRGENISVTHLAGSAFGTAIANSGNDRTIDTQTTVGIDLRNAGPTLLASAALRIEDVANTAMSLRQ